MSSIRNGKWYLPKGHLRAITRIAVQEAKNDAEICGLLIDNGYFIEIIRAHNKSRSGGSFSFYFKEIRGIRNFCKRLGYQLVGTFHSHSADFAVPSTSDIENSVDGQLMLIIDAMRKKAVLWRIKKKRARKVKYHPVFCPRSSMAVLSTFQNHAHRVAGKKLEAIR